MTMTKQERSAYNKAYYQRRKANGGKRLTKVSRTKSAIYQRKRRANSRKQYLAAKKSYDKSRARILKRIKSLDSVSSGFSNGLKANLNRIDNTLEVNYNSYSNERNLPLGSRKNTINSLRNYSDSVKSIMRSDVASVKAAKNMLAGMAQYRANNHSNSNIKLRKSRTGNLKIVNPTKASKKSFNSAKAWVRRHGGDENHIFAIYRSIETNSYNVNSERLEEVISDYVDTHDSGYINDPRNIRDIVDDINDAI